MSKAIFSNSAKDNAYIITGPTSGIGRATAFELAKYGTIILVGRNATKLKELEDAMKQKGLKAVAIMCDVSDMTSIQQAAKKIIALPFVVSGLLNNAGIMPQQVTKNAQGWDMTFATNHLGAFALTEALTPHLPDGANIIFIASAIEDPERKPAKIMGMKGGRFISIEASARGEWKAGGAKLAGIDAYATSKQCILASAMAFARENPRLHFNAVEPGITRGTSLGAESMNPVIHAIFGRIMSVIPPFSKYASTPEESAKTITKVMIDQSNKTGVYFDEKAKPMLGSELSRDPKFQDRVVAETRAFLSKEGFRF